MIQKDMLLGNGSYASVEDHTVSKIWSIANDEDIEWENGEPSGSGARIEANDATYPYLMGTIAGAIINDSGEGITSLPPYDGNTNTCGYFYYSGTAPAPTVIKFTMTPTFDENGYINSPRNNKTDPTYDTITIESENVQELQFTTPNIYTSYNKVIEIFETYFNG